MSNLFKNFSNGKLLIGFMIVLVGYGITGGTYLKSIEDSVVDIKELRVQYNEHTVLVLTQLGILNTEIAGMRRELNRLQRVSNRFGRIKDKVNSIPAFERGTR